MESGRVCSRCRMYRNRHLPLEGEFTRTLDIEGVLKEIGYLEQSDHRESLVSATSQLFPSQH